MATPEEKYNKNNYAPAELRLVDAKYGEIAPQLAKILAAKPKEEKVALANALAQNQKGDIMKDPKVAAAVIFTLVCEKLFRANQYTVLSEDQKMNRAAGKAFFTDFRGNFKDYFFERAAMKKFDNGLLMTMSGLLVNFANEDPVFRKSVIARMNTVLLRGQGNVDNGVTVSTIIAPLVRASELIPTLKRLQDTPGLGNNEKELYRITVQAIERAIQAVPEQKQVPLKH
jgi:hypothetical protein